MKIRVRYFGRFAVMLDMFSEVLEVPEGIKVKDLIAILRERHPELKHEEIEVSIGGRYASEDAEIGEEVAIYPPISGG